MGRAWGIGALLALCAGTAAAEPDGVTYLLGGAASGPYRVSVNLDAGVATEAVPPAGKHGDGAGLSAAEMPVTATRALPPGAAARIRRLAAPVWDAGAYIPSATCKPSIDALWRFRIVQAGEARVFDVPAVCANPGAHALQEALVCAVHPDGPRCPAGPGQGHPARVP